MITHSVRPSNRFCYDTNKNKNKHTFWFINNLILLCLIKKKKKYKHFLKYTIHTRIYIILDVILSSNNIVKLHGCRLVIGKKKKKNVFSFHLKNIFYDVSGRLFDILWSSSHSSWQLCHIVYIKTVMTNG